MHTNEKETHQRGESTSTSLQPDPETLHKTDPQENMEGPLSSALSGIGDAFKTDETKEEADEEKERNM